MRIISAAKKFSLLKDFDEEKLENLAEAMNEKPVKKGEVIFEEATVSDT